MKLGRCPWVVGERYSIDSEYPIEVTCGARTVETRSGFRCTAGHRYKQRREPAYDDPWDGFGDD